MAATGFQPTYPPISMLRIALVVAVLMIGYHVFGQEDSVEESETTDVDESSSEEATEETTAEESETEGDDSEDSTTQISDEDSSTTQEDSTTADATNEEPPTDDETEESEDTDFEDFIPTEKLSEDIEISFPVDI